MTSNTNRTARRIVLLSAAILLAATLAGCTPEARAAILNKPAGTTASATSTPAPTAAAPKPGDTLTGAQAVALRKSLPKNGDWVYTTSAGVNIMINSHELLPEPVKADASAQLAAAAQAGHDANDTMNPTLGPVIKRISGSMGKPVVVIVRIWTGNDAGDAKVWRWAVQGPAAKPGLANRFPDAASAVASVQGYIASQPQTTKWEVLVAG
ncbi:hypothetical protein F1C58_16075 (plasmid) [Glaciihabitans sp. INWT7]|uniref:hypothetical protein n=1 Tax=Glaciihabitans sp. INWT7 TaxID=2596912 RepID=UPI001625C5FA|nr:hypothetical protein [Glaciihabitans sp. INWT7]QNE48721.1 hypothetical protein F1C58_16075 [Glaciihabitans sp. INWT7]